MKGRITFALMVEDVFLVGEAAATEQFRVKARPVHFVGSDIDPCRDFPITPKPFHDLFSRSRYVPVGLRTSMIWKEIFAGGQWMFVVGAVQDDVIAIQGRNLIPAISGYLAPNGFGAEEEVTAELFTDEEHGCYGKSEMPQRFRT